MKTSEIHPSLVLFPAGESVNRTKPSLKPKLPTADTRRWARRQFHNPDPVASDSGKMSFKIWFVGVGEKRSRSHSSSLYLLYHTTPLTWRGGWGAGSSETS